MIRQQNLYEILDFCSKFQFFKVLNFDRPLLSNVCFKTNSTWYSWFSHQWRPSRKCRFLTKMPIFDENADFWRKFRFFLAKNFDYWRSFRFLMKMPMFGENFVFFENFDFLLKLFKFKPGRFRTTYRYTVVPISNQWGPSRLVGSKFNIIYGIFNFQFLSIYKIIDIYKFYE